MRKNSYVVGIDGGGTKTAAMLADPNGTILAEDTGGPSNFQLIGVDQAAQVLFSVIQGCCGKAGCALSDVKSVVAGLTGAGRESDRERMQQAFHNHTRGFGTDFDLVTVESDARIALEGAFKGGSGIILIAGTGSIAFGKAPGGAILRVGGWGRLVGDEGSGYSIGKDGLNIVSKELDGRGGKTLLTKLVAEKFGLSNQEQIITAVYRNNFDIASLAPLVIEAAAKQDKECERILNRAAFELSEHVRSLTFKIEEAARGTRKKIPLAFIGSILTSENIFSRVVKHKIEYSLPQVSVIKPQSAPAHGAVLMALEQMKQKA
ncbi:MAG: hypothetical protein HYW57_00870 [Ignavibacteriales bacterium]|nr:hypothetical protein [Ignavibacteriales bacterium]